MSARRQSVAVHGSYMGNNFGDILLVKLYVSWIQSMENPPEVILPTASGQACREIGANGRGLMAARRASALLFTGGGYFGEPSTNTSSWGRRNMLRHGLLGLQFLRRRKPLAIVGVGAGPISFAPFRSQVVEMCERSKVLAVRDEASRDYLVQYGVQQDRIEVTADAALTLTASDIPYSERRRAKDLFTAHRSKKIVGVHLAHTMEHSEETARVYKSLAKTLEASTNCQIVLLSDGTTRKGTLSTQQRAGRQFAGLLQDKVAIELPYESVWRLAAVLNELDAVITTKLHVGIVSSALGTPALAIPHHQKTPRLYQQLGLSRFCLPISQYDEKQFSSALEEGLAAKALHVDRVPMPVREAAQLNKKRVEEFIAGLV